MKDYVTSYARILMQLIAVLYASGQQLVVVQPSQHLYSFLIKLTKVLRHG